MVHEIEDFYGVYLLYCLNPRYKGKTYIGYTVNPNRRIKQHNTGAHAGGANRTSGRGPWDMVLIIHGFPNDVSGLRFEWAWQNPHKSRRLRDVPKKTYKETTFQYSWRVVCNMLRTPPWSGLALTIRWLKQEYQLEFAVGLEPPLHMPVVYGPVVSKKIRNQKKSKKDESCKPSQASSSGSNKSDLPENNFCAVCCIRTEKDDITLRCLHPSCSMVAHIICLAKSFLDDQTKLLPIEGKCPKCRANLLWGELVRQRNGCYKNLSDSAVQQDDDKANTSLETENADSMSE
ncbi:structure-specific endonuclease subunit slx1 [Biomphalaria glabrata]|uniref:Structure-specific endonuclease subunit SLX1 homolog n=1 Tax=Biomphalaria glabrata TaxID=6526 RepID=A0A2C9JG39_BIOGL|nr:structure-specific endonuclease subunit slx1 [Biomphalaria glabrata]